MTQIGQKRAWKNKRHNSELYILYMEEIINFLFFYVFT